jgi:hypothetical protein
MRAPVDAGRLCPVGVPPELTGSDLVRTDLTDAAAWKQASRAAQQPYIYISRAAASTSSVGGVERDRGDVGAVVVADDHGHRRVPRQIVEHGGRAHVPGVQGSEVTAGTSQMGSTRRTPILRA